ncbi:hypothetical protein X275_03535 [Marinitoga sp. 1197]|uniref:SoxR reducing system RseC family protein n=1 Tax=unclassified Marinitoga TaxID=2640159 RepID=UPI000641634C|nr:MULTISPECIES: SoxR reducing system RseC family protein [unclassified Marinitoga]KLO22448.1 hypothetical protein X274_08090 [Marinitoga sp. 1155]KLO23253.1 hypothetical protein X275_03535 [Marinitoga sp. 1197]NUV00246.1 hypothetical protein [Marinitoga sp. 1154]
MKELMKVVDIGDEYIYVQALEAANCSSCVIKGSCNLTGDPNRKIRAINKSNLNLNRNDFVYIKKEDSLESQAAFVMYGIPLLIMIVLTIVLFVMGLNEIISFFSGLSGMVISYYFIHIYDKNIAKTKYIPEIIEKLQIYNNFQL